MARAMSASALRRRSVAKPSTTFVVSRIWSLSFSATPATLGASASTLPPHVRETCAPRLSWTMAPAYPRICRSATPARVTSKLESIHVDRWGVHGRGMALYSVRENAESARVASSAPGKGTSITVVTNATKLAERTDQSTWPSLGEGEDGKRTCARGPHNIVRTCCEFALEEYGTCEVYVGSPAEIAATARARITPSVDGSDLLFIDDLSALPVWRSRAAADARELLWAARGLVLR